MICLTVLYGQPTNLAEFDRYYKETHLPLAVKIPGLKGYTLDRPKPLNPSDTSPYHLIACLYFDSLAAMQAGFASSEGQAAAGDVPNFATGGATLLADEQEIVMPFSRG